MGVSLLDNQALPQLIYVDIMEFDQTRTETMKWGSKIYFQF